MVLSDLEGVFPAVLLPLPAYLIVALWLSTQFNLPWLAVGLFALTCVAIHTPLLLRLWRGRRLVWHGWRRILGGPATVHADDRGIEFRRRWWSETNTWADVRHVEKQVDLEAGEPDQYALILVFANNASILVDDNADWKAYRQLNNLSSGILEERATAHSLVVDATS